MKKSLLILCWLVATPATLLAVLIVLPAPHYYFWMAAVVASEWSVWLVLAGLISLAAAGSILFSERRNRAAQVGVALSLITIVCTVLPVIEAYRVAAHQGVGLSWSRYLFGIRNADGPYLIAEQHDVEFARPAGKVLRLDVYHPRGSRNQESQTNAAATSLMPAIIVIHGGSWRSGEKSDFARFDRWLAESGRVVFDIDYRLANSTQRFPAQLVDVESAILWVKSHATQYRVDPNRIALMGRSAGGQLALLAAYAAKNANEPSGSSDGHDTRVRAVISFYGPTDLVWDYENPGRPDVIDSRRVLENYLGGPPTTAAQAYQAASPIEQIGGHLPPTLLLHGGHDQLVRKENAERLIPKLAAAGVPYTYIPLRWANHGFDYNFNGWSSQIVQAEISKFLDTYL